MDEESKRFRETKGLETLKDKLEKKQSQEEKTGGTGIRTPNMAIIIKPAEVSSWTKYMSLDMFI